MLHGGRRRPGRLSAGLHPPPADDGWTRCELVNNCRNTFGIASMLHRHLGGAPRRPRPGVARRAVAARRTITDAVVELVGEEIDRIEAEGYATPRVLVATSSTTAARPAPGGDGLRARGRAASEHSIVCENVHRVKGLEFDFVVLAARGGRRDRLLLYVGLSRAIVGFTVIGSRALAERL